jgi:hypothetical protein
MLEKEMVRNIEGRDGQKYGRRRWYEILEECLARNVA